MHRFYLPADQWNAPVYELTGQEAHHATKVLRIAEGDTCTVFDGKGHARLARVCTPPSASSVCLEPGNLVDSPPIHTHITLCQAVPKGGNMDLIIQKAVELGVSHITPLLTERTIVRISSQERSSKQAKWQRTALEACKQCGQNTLPVIAPPVTYNEWLASHRPEGLNMIASLTDQAQPIRTVLEQARAQGTTHAAVLIGPEGDFTAEETQAAIEAGFLPISLGSIVLRVETAVFFSISAIRYALD